MKQQDLLKRMNKLNLGAGKKLDKQHLSEFLLGKSKSFLWCRRIEIGLGLPKNYLINMMGKPTTADLQKIKKLEDFLKE